MHGPKNILKNRMHCCVPVATELYEDAQSEKYF